MNLIIIFLIIIVICQFFYIVRLHRGYDGKLEVNEARDSWTVSIRTHPEDVKKKRCIRLRVEVTDK